MWCPLIVFSYVAQGVKNAEHLILGVHGRGPLSQGTMHTMVEGFLTKGAVRESEVLRLVPIAHRSSVLSFANGKRSCMTVPWGDVSTSFILPVSLIFEWSFPQRRPGFFY